MPGQPLERLAPPGAAPLPARLADGRAAPEVGEVWPAEGGMRSETVEAVFDVAVGQPVEEHEVPLGEVARSLLTATVGGVPAVPGGSRRPRR